MEKPARPPEAVLLRTLREAADLTQAQAATAAGMSDARWSQAENGYESRKGVYVPVRVKPGNLARMFRVVGASPERVAAEGHRDDAATILEELIRDNQAEETGRPRQPLPAVGEVLEEAGLPILDHGVGDGLGPFAQEVRDDLARAMAAYGPGFAGADAFTDKIEAWIWDRDSVEFSPQAKVKWIALMRQASAEVRPTRRKTSG